MKQKLYILWCTCFLVGVYSLSNGGYIRGLSLINMAKMSNESSFLTPEPVDWVNADMSRIPQQ